MFHSNNTEQKGGRLRTDVMFVVHQYENEREYKYFLEQKELESLSWKKLWT